MNPLKIENNQLVCPDCGSTYLRHHTVTAIFRDSEDSDGTATVSTTQETKVLRRGDKRIEGRRDVVYIEFNCENCSGIKKLSVVQHKGNTLLEWSKYNFTEV